MARAKTEPKTSKYSTENNIKRGNRYTTEQKLQCLMVLQANKFSLNKASQQTGVSDMTLKSWLTTYGNELFGNAQEAKIEGETNEMISIMPLYEKQINTDQAQFLALAHEVKLKALRLLEQKLKRTSNVAALTFIIKTLDKATFDASKLPTGGTEQPKSGPNFGKQVNVFQNIHNKYSLPNPDQDTSDE